MKEYFGFEKIVKKEAKGSLLLTKILLITSYSLVAALGLFGAFTIGGKDIALILLVLAVDVCFILLTWKYTIVEYEYSIAADYFFVAKIYNKSSRKEIFDEELIRVTTVAPYNEKYESTAADCKPDTIIRAVSSMSADNIWFAIFDRDGSKKTLVFFEADEAVISSFRHFCPRVTAKDRLTKVEEGEKENA